MRNRTASALTDRFWRRRPVRVGVAVLALTAVAGIAYAAATTDTATVTSTAMSAGRIRAIDPSQVAASTTCTNARCNSCYWSASRAAGAANAGQNNYGNISGTPWELLWPADTTGSVDHYEVVLTLVQDTYGNGLVVGDWEDNNNTAGFGRPSGVTWVPARRDVVTTTYNTSTNNNIPRGMINPAPPTGGGTTGGLPRSSTYILPNVISLDSGTTATTGIRWGVWWNTGVGGTSETLRGSVTVTAVGPGGWRSDPYTVYWSARYAQTAFCRTVEADTCYQRPPTTPPTVPCT